MIRLLGPSRMLTRKISSSYCLPTLINSRSRYSRLVCQNSSFYCPPTIIDDNRRYFKPVNSPISSPFCLPLAIDDTRRYYQLDTRRYYQLDTRRYSQLDDKRGFSQLNITYPLYSCILNRFQSRQFITNSALLQPSENQNLLHSRSFSLGQISRSDKNSTWSRLKQMVRDYWYVIVPVEIGTSVIWYGAIYVSLKSGLDLPSLLESIGVSEETIAKLPDSETGYGYHAIAIICYKVISPVRHTVSLGISAWVVTWLKKNKPGLLPTSSKIAKDGKEKGKEKMENARERVENVKEKVGDAREKYVDNAKEMYGDAKEKYVDTKGKYVDNAKEMYGDAKGKYVDTKDKYVDNAKEMYGGAKEKYVEGKKQIGEKMGDLKGKAKEQKSDIKEDINKLRERIAKRKRMNKKK